MVLTIALGAVILLYVGVAMFSLVWLFASERLTFLKPAAWLNTLMNIIGLIVLLTVALAHVVLLYRALGVLMVPGGGS